MMSDEPLLFVRQAFQYTTCNSLILCFLEQFGIIYSFIIGEICNDLLG